VEGRGADELFGSARSVRIRVVAVLCSMLSPRLPAKTTKSRVTFVRAGVPAWSWRPRRTDLTKSSRWTVSVGESEKDSTVRLWLWV
jgi:hypothetical protein